MMAALLQKELGDGFQVRSAGTWREGVGQPANHFSILCMQERGINLSDHKSRWIGNIDLTRFSHIVCANGIAAERVYQFLAECRGVTILIANEDRGGVLDPFGKGLSAYRKCIALLDEVVPKIAERIRR